jgi:AcrR family transcriptional regulator
MAAPRGEGREALLTAATMRLAGLELRDLLEGIRLNQVAVKSGYSGGTRSHHFKTKDEFLDALVKQVLETALAEDPYLALKSALCRLAASQGGNVSDLVGAVARELESMDCRPSAPLATRAEGILYPLLVAAAPNDANARARLGRYVATVRGRYVELLTIFLEASGRQLRHDWSLDTLALVVLALTDGFLGARRLNAQEAPHELYGDVLLRLLLACTVDPAASGPDPVDGLVARVEAAAPPATPEQRAAIIDAAGRAYSWHGWTGLTLDAVARQAGIDRGIVARLLVDRRGLAVAVWSAKCVPTLARMAELAAGVEDVRTVVATYLETLVELARQDTHLSAHLLEALFAGHVRPASEPAAEELRGLVPVPDQLVPLLRQRAAQLRPGQADTDEQAYEAAALLCNSALHLAATRPHLSPAAVVHRICDTVVRGMQRVVG